MRFASCVVDKAPNCDDSILLSALVVRACIWAVPNAPTPALVSDWTWVVVKRLTNPVANADTWVVVIAVKSAACKPATCVVCNAPMAELVRDCNWLAASEANWLVLRAATTPESTTAN